jgi:AraC-like DNA-binding protein
MSPVCFQPTAPQKSIRYWLYGTNDRTLVPFAVSLSANGALGQFGTNVGYPEAIANRSPCTLAISWLRANFSQSMRVEELAELMHMSVSSFHQHFRSVTSMGPLYYQKVLLLQESRRLMLSTMINASTACQRVRYLSSSQFSREYSRFFGSAPTKEIARLRQETRP